METFRWSSNFVTGLTEVDEQHSRLVELINRFGDHVMRQQGVTHEDIEAVFAELAEYARYHFSEEESLMSAAGLDARHLEQHRQAHANFLDEVTQLHKGVTPANLDAAKSLLQFLTHWLAYHILGSDQFMAKQIAAIKSGCSAAEAYQAVWSSKDPATDTLLTALNGLFHQVSERNRELVELNRNLEARVAERTRALRDANQLLEDQANTDTLTGLPNRRYALHNFAMEWQASVRDGTPITCMMVDADGFKQINDAHGHDAGDLVLQALAARLRNAIRTDDIVCRLGGDEFLVICPRTPLDGALKLAETIRRDVAALRVRTGGGEWCGSISIGVATRNETMTGVDGLIKSADEGVYLAKRNGRNRVACLQR